MQFKSFTGMVFRVLQWNVVLESLQSFLNWEKPLNIVYSGFYNQGGMSSAGECFHHYVTFCLWRRCMKQRLVGSYVIKQLL